MNSSRKKTGVLSKDKQLNRSSAKKKVKQQQPEQKNKITNYMVSALSNKKTRINIQKDCQRPHQDKQQLEIYCQIGKNTFQISGLKGNCQSIKKKCLQQKQICLNRQKIIAASMLQIAKLKRIDKLRNLQSKKLLIDYSEGLKKFKEGKKIIQSRQKIKEVERQIQKIRILLKQCEISPQEETCLLGRLQFKNKELIDLKTDLKYLRRDADTLYDHMKLLQKQDKCNYSLEQWPIIQKRYQTLQLLGSGGFGEVYKCYDLQVDKIVAVKRICFAQATKQILPQYISHMRRQIAIQSKLNHPNIAKITRTIEINQDKKYALFELQYYQGPVLSSYIRSRGRLDELQAKIIIKQIFCGLDYLSHLKQRIIHYDLKPANIIFHEGIVKIIDFGLCKAMNQTDDSQMELTSQGVGTYWYLPPETFQEKNPKISPKLDVWSAGVILYQMLFGERPFGAGMSQGQIYAQEIILNAKEVRFPESVKISSSAKEFLRGCLRFNPDERFGAFEAFNHYYLKI